MVFRDAWERLLNFILPQHLVCHCCEREAVVNDYGVCKECEIKLSRVRVVTQFEDLDGFTAGLIYNEPARNSLLAFKFGNALYQKELLTHFMRIPEEWSFDYVVPVPLHKKRLRERGYNQSAVLAKELCKRYNLVMMEELLVKLHETPKQAKLHANERYKNLKGAYSASEMCKGRSILLVDDVRTTGTTLHECASTLRRAGAVRVYAITACCVGLESFDDTVN